MDYHFQDYIFNSVQSPVELEKTPQSNQCFPLICSSIQEPVAGPSVCQQLRQLLKDALQNLQDEGVIYRKVISPDQVYHVRKQQRNRKKCPFSVIYHYQEPWWMYCMSAVLHQVTANDKDLFMAVTDIIREDSKREKCKWI